MKHSGLQFLKNVSSSEHRTPKERYHWLKGTSLKAGDEFGARGWIHGCRYTECWDTYSSQSKQLKSDVCDALTAAGLCDSELEGILCCQPFSHAHLLHSFRLIMRELPTSIWGGRRVFQRYWQWCCKARTFLWPVLHLGCDRICGGTSSPQCPCRAWQCRARPAPVTAALWARSEPSLGHRLKLEISWKHRHPHCSRHEIPQPWVKGRNNTKSWKQSKEMKNLNPPP